jgi:hypothetical protein
MNLENEMKKICILGTNSRYQIKKITQVKEIKKRKNINFDTSLDYEKQLQLLHLYTFTQSLPPFYSEINKKLSGYKSQDQKKKLFCNDKFITFEQTLIKLKECNLTCYYCANPIYIFYEIVRENKQWTLDRIDNSLGHYNDNVLISCLECNLKRKTTNKNYFLFSKQLVINKTIK